MPASSPRRHRQPRYTARLLIHLDAEAEAKLEALRAAVGRLPPQGLRYVIDWGLRQEEAWCVDRRRVEHPTDTLVVRLEPEVRTQLHAAAKAAGAEASAWTCHALHRVTLEDLLATWRTGEPDPHSHDSRAYDQRYMLRINGVTRYKLDALSKHLGKSIAEVIRHLVAQATPEDVPPDWQTANAPPGTDPWP